MRCVYAGCHAMNRHPGHVGDCCLHSLSGLDVICQRRGIFRQGHKQISNQSLSELSCIHAVTALAGSQRYSLIMLKRRNKGRVLLRLLGEGSREDINLTRCCRCRNPRRSPDFGGDWVRGERWSGRRVCDRYSLWNQWRCLCVHRSVRAGCHWWWRNRGDRDRGQHNGGGGAGGGDRFCLCECCSITILPGRCRSTSTLVRILTT
mmetsp:Transcript_45358/g.81565  ORF Transcript_45358/g.81565 Transcript_45358/m.81565 type:complete len:205 (+) Transcript_45358:506-1120(+)